MTSLLIGTWIDFVHSTVAGGYVVALAVICLFQYVVHLHRLSKERKQTAQFRAEINGMESALTQVQKDRTVTRYENQILREFVSQTECDKAMSLLLRRFVPNPEEGFAAFLQLENNAVVVAQSRGLTTLSCERMQIDPKLLSRLQETESVVLEGNALADSLIWSKISAKDRQKVHQIFLLPVGESNQLLGVLMTTDLFPAGAERTQQIELAERLMLSVGISLKHKLALESHQSQLQLTNEMLQLRSITDRRFDSPVLMIEEFIRQLTGKVHADRTTLFIATQESDTPFKALARTGDTLQNGVREQWQKHEDILARAAFCSREILKVDSEGLQRLGIQSLIGSALIVPLVQPQGTIGLVCLTKGSREGFAVSEEQLAVWGAEYLGDTILRAVNQAAVERQARLDGLTQLANRRTFDSQIAHELQFAKGSGSPCSLLLFDLDRFKMVNDTHGHRAGDYVLRKTAEILRERVRMIRSGDRALAARYGGEELAVLLPGIGWEGALRIAESIRAGIEAMVMDFEGTQLRITTSVGLASFPVHGDTPEDVIATADTALYQAKAAGRNRVGIPQSVLA